MKWNGTRAWIFWPMHVCPILILFISCHRYVSYTYIKRWRKFQNGTQFLESAALLFLISQPSINKWQNWIANGIELGFSPKLFNKINDNMPQVSFWAVLMNEFFGQLISHPQLKRSFYWKLEKLASSTWSLHAAVLHELFMRFSEWKSESACKSIQYTENICCLTWSTINIASSTKECF
jgi:hypothetical protein